jgi:esterase
MASAVDRAVEAIHLGRFVIVGHSYSGAVVATYAARHSEKVAGVIYIDAAASALALSGEQKERLSASLRADKMRVVRGWFAPMLKGSSQDVQEEVLASVERTPTEVFFGALMSLSAYDAQTVVNAYSGPRLAIVAADLESAASFQKQFPAIPAVRISGAGHWLMLDKPRDVEAAIDAFLARVPR